MRYTGQGVVQRRLEGVVVEIQKGGGRFAWPALELERWAVMQQFDVKIEFVEAAAHFQQATACARCLYGFRRLQYRLGGAAYRIAPGGPDAALFFDKLNDLLGMCATGVRVQLKRCAPRGAPPENKVQISEKPRGGDEGVS